MDETASSQSEIELKMPETCQECLAQLGEIIHSRFPALANRAAAVHLEKLAADINDLKLILANRVQAAMLLAHKERGELLERETHG